MKVMKFGSILDVSTLKLTKTPTAQEAPLTLKTRPDLKSDSCRLLFILEKRLEYTPMGARQTRPPILTKN